jgi:hypothetical protein
VIKKVNPPMDSANATSLIVMSLLLTCYATTG